MKIQRFAEYSSYSTPKNYSYAYCCISPDSYEELDFIVDNMEEISCEEFLKVISLDEINEHNSQGFNWSSTAKLKADWASRYYKCSDSLHNVDSYIFKNSAIENIWKLDGTNFISDDDLDMETDKELED